MQTLAKFNWFNRALNHFLFSYVSSIAYSMISIIGIVGNVAVFIVVTKSPQMRTLTNKLIGNLAVADLLVNVVCVPFTLVANLYPGKLTPMFNSSQFFSHFILFLQIENGLTLLFGISEMIEFLEMCWASCIFITLKVFFAVEISIFTSSREWFLRTFPNE